MEDSSQRRSLQWKNNRIKGNSDNPRTVAPMAILPESHTVQVSVKSEYSNPKNPLFQNTDSGPMKIHTLLLTPSGTQKQTYVG